MFGRNNNDFDNLEEYRRQKPSVDSYFEREDDFDYGESTQRKETRNNESNPYNNETHNNPRDKRRANSDANIPQYGGKKNKSGLDKLVQGVVTLIIIGFGFLFVIGFLFGDDGGPFTGDNEKPMYELSDYENITYNGKKKITNQEFVKLYNEAKNNRIKYDRLTKKYISGDYKKNYVVNERYITSQPSIEMNEEDGESITYSCLKDKETEYENGEAKYGEIISCGISAQVDKGNYPTDIISNKEIEVYDYLPHASESMDRYYINGVYYSQELADLIVKEASGK